MKAHQCYLDGYDKHTHCEGELVFYHNEFSPNIYCERHFRMNYSCDSKNGKGVISEEEYEAILVLKE